MTQTSATRPTSPSCSATSTTSSPATRRSRRRLTTGSATNSRAARGRSIDPAGTRATTPRCSGPKGGFFSPAATSRTAGPGSWTVQSSPACAPVRGRFDDPGAARGARQGALQPDLDSDGARIAHCRAGRRACPHRARLALSLEPGRRARACGPRRMAVLPGLRRPRPRGAGYPSRDTLPRNLRDERDRRLGHRLRVRSTGPSARTGRKKRRGGALQGSCRGGGQGDCRSGRPRALRPRLRDAIEAAVITTERLVLVPLQEEDAEELAEILFDGRLHDFIGSPPGSQIDVRDRFVLLAAGSPRPGEHWLNWVVRRRHDSVAVGTVQATVREVDGLLSARLGWMIGIAWQNRGFASEAATALVRWMRWQRVDEIAANIHPEHDADAAVARRAGLRQTEEVHDGERVWRAPSIRGGAHAGQG